MPGVAEKPYTGLTAKIAIDTVDLAYMSGFDLDMDKSIIEILQFGAIWKEKVPAIKDWTGHVDGTAAFMKGGSQESLYTAYKDDTVVTIKAFLDENNFFEGKALIKNLHIDAAPDDKINITCDFEGTGALALTVAGGV